MAGFKFLFVASLAAIQLLEMCDAFALAPAAVPLRHSATGAQRPSSLGALRPLGALGRGCRGPATTALQMATTKSFKNFDDMIENSDAPAILVDFYATWCGPCVLMSKELSKLSQSMGEEVAVFKVNTEKYPAISSRYEVYALPTCILFKGGKAVERFEGVLMADKIEELVRKHL